MRKNVLNQHFQPLCMSLNTNIFFVILGVSFIILAGCISPQQSPDTPVTTPDTPEITPVPTTEPAMPPVTTPPGSTFTKEEVGQLFIDIAFGCDNTWVNKIYPSPENHLFYSLEGQVSTEDKGFVMQFAEQYNLLSSTETFSDDPISTKGNPIIFYPVDSLNSLDKEFISCQERDPETGTLIYMIYKPVIEYPSGERVVTTKIYLNSDLTGAQRMHYLERALLYYLGFPGQTYTYPDSVFYYNTQSNVDFIPIDVEAIKTMYQPGIYWGMSVQQVRWLLLDT